LREIGGTVGELLERSSPTPLQERLSAVNPAENLLRKLSAISAKARGRKSKKGIPFAKRRRKAFFVVVIHFAENAVFGGSKFFEIQKLFSKKVFGGGAGGKAPC
jgi:hypothetical protein